MKETFWVGVLAVVMFVVALLARGQTTVTMGGQFRASSTLLLIWDASPTPGVTYKVKRAEVTGGPYTVVATVAATTYRDTNVRQGTIYCYVITATDGSTESDPLAEVCKAV